MLFKPPRDTASGVGRSSRSLMTPVCSRKVLNPGFSTMLNGLKSRQRIKASRRTRIGLAFVWLWVALGRIGVDENSDGIRICRLAQLEVPDLGGGAVISERRVKKSQIRMNELRTTVFISVHNT